MSLTLHLGVVDIPYVSGEKKAAQRKRAKAGRKAAAGSTGGITTGDVATILESKYGVMQTFYDAKQALIAKDLEVSVADAIDSLMMGAPAGINAFGAATSKIESRFHDFITAKEMDGLGVQGVPTMASVKGVSHRFKKKRGSPGRPSFVDTGLYLTSFMSWVD